MILIATGANAPLSAAPRSDAKTYACRSRLGGESALAEETAPGHLGGLTANAETRTNPDSQVLGLTGVKTLAGDQGSPFLGGRARSSLLPVLKAARHSNAASVLMGTSSVEESRGPGPAAFVAATA